MAENQRPAPRFQNRLIEMGILTQSDVDRFEKEVSEQIEAAIEAVKKLPPRFGSGPMVNLAVGMECNKSKF